MNFNDSIYQLINQFSSGHHGQRAQNRKKLHNLQNRLRKKWKVGALGLTFIVCFIVIAIK